MGILNTHFWGSFSLKLGKYTLFWAWEGAVILPQIRPRKIPSKDIHFYILWYRWPIKIHFKLTTKRCLPEVSKATPNSVEFFFLLQKWKIGHFWLNISQKLLDQMKYFLDKSIDIPFFLRFIIRSWKLLHIFVRKRAWKLAWFTHWHIAAAIIGNPLTSLMSSTIE